MKLNDIIKMHVLRFLPAKSLCRFKAVCKEWDEWINSPFFAHEQANYYRKTSEGFFFFSQSPNNYEHYSEFISLDDQYSSSCGIPFLPAEFSKIRSSCNGLICCQQKTDFADDGDFYIICNPATQKWAELPPPKLFHGPKTAVSPVFEPSTLNFNSHFELVCAVPDGFFVLFEIYSSRTNSWRVAESEYYNNEESYSSNHGCNLRFRDDHGFYMNGFVYWQMCSNNNGNSNLILVFDLKDEQYGELQVPTDHHPKLRGVLTKMNKELCFIKPTTNENENENDQQRRRQLSLDVYGDHDMVLKRRIPLELGDLKGKVRVLGCVDDEVLIILVGKILIAYDVREMKSKILKEFKLVGKSNKFMGYVNSLVCVSPVSKMSPDDFCAYMPKC